MKSRFSDEKIIAVLKQAEAGTGRHPLRLVIVLEQEPVI